MAHVIAKKPKGPRGISSSKEDNSYKNLILLCANHHIEVDQNEHKYTVELLNKIKSEHEHFIKSSLNQTNHRANDLNLLRQFIKNSSFLRIPFLINRLPIAIHADFLCIGDVFSDLVTDNPYLFPFNDILLGRHFTNFLDAYQNLQEIICVRAPVPGGSVQLFGLIQPDGYIYIQKHPISSETISHAYEMIEKEEQQLRIHYQNLINYIREYYGSAL